MKMTEEKEELEGVFMALCDQRNDEQCLEVLRRWKAQILKETLTKIKIEGSWRGFMREYVKAGGKLSEKDKEIYGDLEQEAKV
jgi:hypothetical protein